MPEYREWLTDMMRALDWLALCGQWSAINCVLKDYPAALPVECAVGLLRFTSSFPRERLPEWPPLLERTEAACDAQGLDGKHVLRGLYGPPLMPEFWKAMRN